MPLAGCFLLLPHTPLSHTHTLVSKCRSSCKINIYFYSFSLPFFILLLYLLGLPGRAYKLNALQLATAAISFSLSLPFSLSSLSLFAFFLVFFSARINSLLHPQKHLMQPCHQLPWQHIQNLNKKQIEVMLATSLPPVAPFSSIPCQQIAKCQMFNVVKGNQKVETKYRPATSE